MDSNYFYIKIIDVLGSAKGWAASLLFHPELKSQFQAFATRPDTFSLGVCNGCQLMSLLGWVGTSGKLKIKACMASICFITNVFYKSRVS